MAVTMYGMELCDIKNPLTHNTIKSLGPKGNIIRWVCTSFGGTGRVVKSGV